MVVLASGPAEVFGRTWQIHTMLGFVALTLIGAQVIQLGVFARTYARVQIGERDPLLDRLGRGLRLEHGLLAGGRSSSWPSRASSPSARSGRSRASGDLSRAYETALLATTLGLGMQVIFGAFFLALLDNAAPTRESLRRLKP